MEKNMDHDHKPVHLTESEMLVIVKMATLPIKLITQIPEDVVSEAIDQLMRKRMFGPEDVPTAEERETYDKLCEKWGLPSSADVSFG